MSIDISAQSILITTKIRHICTTVTQDLGMISYQGLAPKYVFATRNGSAFLT
jgi:hypothetical protein